MTLGCAGNTRADDTHFHKIEGLEASSCDKCWQGSGTSLMRRAFVIVSPRRFLRVQYNVLKADVVMALSYDRHADETAVRCTRSDGRFGKASSVKNV